MRLNAGIFATILFIIFRQTVISVARTASATRQTDPPWGVLQADEYEEPGGDVDPTAEPMEIEPIEPPETINATYDERSSPIVTRLLNGYDPRVIPSESKSTPVDISMSMYLSHLALTEEPTLSLHVQATLQQNWRDEKLGWNPADYDGVKNVFLHEDEKIWLPRLGCLNRGCGSRHNLGRDVPKRVHLRVSESSRFQHPFVTLSYVIDLKTDCQHDVGAFPRDEITCRLLLVSRHPLVSVILSRRETKAQMVFIRGQTRPVEELPVPGWTILSATQSIKVYDLYKVHDKNPREIQKQFFRGVFELEIRLRRRLSGHTLMLLLVSWETVLLLLSSLLVAVASAPFMVLMSVYFHSIVLRPILYRIPETIDGPVPPLVLQSLLTWIFSVLSALFHEIILVFPALTTRIFPPKVTKWLPFYERLDKRLTVAGRFETPTIVLYLRLTLLVSFVVSYALVAVEYVVE